MKKCYNKLTPGFRKKQLFSGIVVFLYINMHMIRRKLKTKNIKGDINECKLSLISFQVHNAAPSEQKGAWVHCLDQLDIGAQVSDVAHERTLSFELANWSCIGKIHLNFDLKIVCFKPVHIFSNKCDKLPGKVLLCHCV